jgi:DNA polymerase III delta subunit
MVAQELKPAYLVTGNDRPKVERTLERLRARFDPGSIERLMGGKEGVSGADVVAACNAGTLLAGDRLVLVTEVDGRRGEFDRLSGGWRAADVEAVVEYLRSPAPGTVLCLVGEEVRKDSPLAKACGKVGEVLAWEVPKRDVIGWVGRSFEARGVKAGGDACRALIEIVGDDKLVLAREIDKLATWAAGEPVGLEEVQRLAVPSAESHPWDLTDAWGNRDVAAALTVLEATYARSPRARAGEAAALAARLAAHLTKLMRMKTLLEEGLRPADAAARLGMKDFPGRKLAGQAERFSLEELRNATIRLARLDHGLKGGSRLAPDLELQLAVADVVREPR